MSLGRRMLMKLLGQEGDEMVKIGYFEIENPVYPGSESYQVSDAENVVGVDTGLTTAPQKLLCVYIDEMQTDSKGTSIFSGYSGGNGYYGEKSSDTVSLREATDFRSADALYIRFDEVTGKVYLHVRQWAYLKAGKWMWIAIYPE